MSSNPPSFNIPGLGNLGQSSDSEGLLNHTNPTNNSGNESSVVEKNGAGVTSSGSKTGSSQVLMEPHRPTSSGFGQGPPGTTTYFSPPMLPPPTGGQNLTNARASFGIPADVKDISTTSLLPKSGFAKFAKAGAGENGLNQGGTFNGHNAGSTANFGGGTSSTFPSVSGFSAFNPQPSFDMSSRQPWERDEVSSTSIIRTGNGNSSGDAHANVISTTSTTSGQDAPARLDSSCPTAIGDSKFGSLDISKLTLEAAIFCFGVLATQANFAPRFEYTFGGGGLWGIKLTFWGHTIVKNELVDGKQAAKGAICRQALEALKPQFGSWMVPDLPAKCSTSTAWNWPHVLDKYCLQAGIDSPVYTKYLNEHGYRFEVEISGDSYFGMLKYYRSEAEAKNASAHLGLYSVLVNNTENTAIFPGASFLRSGFANNWDEHEPRARRPHTVKSGIPEVQSIATTGAAPGAQNSLGQNTNNAQDSTSIPSLSEQGQGQQLSKGQRKRKNRQRRKLSENLIETPLLPSTAGNVVHASNGSTQKENQISGGNSVSMGNPNPFPDPNRVPVGRRWNVSTGMLKSQINNCTSHRERVAVICGRLALQDPEYNLDLYNRGFGASEYYAAAFFPNDPYLARAGAIGQTKYTHGERRRAIEECAAEVAKFLLNMVEQDSAEDGAREEVHIKIEPGC